MNEFIADTLALPAAPDALPAARPRLVVDHLDSSPDDLAALFTFCDGPAPLDESAHA